MAESSLMLFLDAIAGSVQSTPIDERSNCDLLWG